MIKTHGRAGRGGIAYLTINQKVARGEYGVGLRRVAHESSPTRSGIRRGLKMHTFVTHFRIDNKDRNRSGSSGRIALKRAWHVT